MNTSDRFNQHGSVITVTWAGYAPRPVAIEGKATYTVPFREYLAPGVHFLHLSLYGQGSEIWLR